jgi:hypothetical protein
MPNMIFEQVDYIFNYYPECLVHPVSCAGVSHDVLSKQIKKSYPDYFREYSRFCIRKHLTAGQAYFYPLNALFGTKYIVSLTIKDNWQEKIRPAVFKSALSELIKKAEELKFSTIAFPKIDEIPFDWLKEQFERVSANNENTIEKILFF